MSPFHTLAIRRTEGRARPGGAVRLWPGPGGRGNAARLLVEKATRRQAGNVCFMSQLWTFDLDAARSKDRSSPRIAGPPPPARRFGRPRRAACKFCGCGRIQAPLNYPKIAAPRPFDAQFWNRLLRPAECDCSLSRTIAAATKYHAKSPFHPQDAASCRSAPVAERWFPSRGVWLHSR